MPSKIIFSTEQLTELRTLIDSGMRQTDIAKHFNVTDDTIRRICREQGWEIRMPHKCTCILCGDVFYSNIKGAKTCKKEHHRNCVICGKDFVVDRTDIKDTCSRECTSLKKYGVRHYLQAEEVKQKRAQTNLEKYGVDNPGKMPDHLEKCEATNLKKYGAKSYAGSVEGRAHIRATNLEKYGCEEPLANSEYRAKIAAINVEKYGTEHPMRTDAIKHKQQATLLENYGVTNPMQSPELLERQHLSVFNNYGVTCPMQVSEIKEQMMQRSLDKHGVPWPIMDPVNRSSSSHSKLNIQFEEKLTENNIEFQSEFRLETMLFDDKCGNNLIEIDPTWSHNSAANHYNSSADPLSKDYHKNKSMLAESHGYRCIHVFDWDNWDSIINLLLPCTRVYARDCSIYRVPKSTADTFTASHHIQGSCYGQHLNYGLFYKGELIQIMTFGKPRYNRKYDFELLRLCSKIQVQVIGGASKLFKRFVSDNIGKSVISYCDLAKFSGNVYEQLGMRLSHVTDPAKIWSKGTEHITDNLLRQRGYDQLFNTNYGKGTSNEELMLDNGWEPVYDCGQKVFVYTT